LYFNEVLRRLILAKCDQGYLCEICGEPVKNIVESSLYLRYVLGEVQLHELFGKPERHLKCDHELAQYIRHEKFEHNPELVAANGNATLTEEQCDRVTQGWIRLREVVHLGIPITEYPLE
tara:strand:+ start:8570 stop:8929 length:360 start_codon:yes stop_codon:yes gene_type:complete